MARVLESSCPCFTAPWFSGLEEIGDLTQVEFKSMLIHLLGVGFQASHLFFLSLSFLICLSGLLLAFKTIVNVMALAHSRGSTDVRVTSLLIIYWYN